MLAPRVGRLIAIEPLASLRRILRLTSPSALVAGGVAERLPLRASAVVGVVAAQAFHWFDGPAALAECHRVLRDGGALILVWNVRDNDVSWVGAISELIEPLRGDTPTYRDGAWRAHLRAHEGFGPVSERTFPYEQPMTVDELVDRHLSISFVASQPADVRAEVEREIRRIAADDPATRHRASFAFPYRTLVASARRAS